MLVWVAISPISSISSKLNSSHSLIINQHQNEIIATIMRLTQRSLIIDSAVYHNLLNRRACPTSIFQPPVIIGVLHNITNRLPPNGLIRLSAD